MKNPLRDYKTLCFCNECNTLIRLFFPLLAATGLFLSQLSSVNAQEPQWLQPEDITQHVDETLTIPAKTIFIEVDDPKEAASLMSDSHTSQAKKGWRVFDISTYQRDEDFRGVFITYVKVGASE